MSGGEQVLPDPGWKLRRVKGIAWRIIEEEAVLVDVRRDEVLHLNPTASYLWSMLDGRTSLEEIALRMTAEFEVEKEDALRDVIDFASRLLEKGVAEVV
ncbi:MAG: PqqD family protein [Actinomycetota bacterium]